MLYMWWYGEFASETEHEVYWLLEPDTQDPSFDDKIIEICDGLLSTGFCLRYEAGSNEPMSKAYAAANIWLERNHINAHPLELTASDWQDVINTIL